MIVKRFRAATMQAALELVKQELGEEAVILKSETVPRSGIFDVKKKPDVEVVAAVDNVPPRPAPVARPRPNLGGSTGYFAPKAPLPEDPPPQAFADLLSGNLGVKSTPAKPAPRKRPAAAAPGRTSSPQAGKAAMREEKPRVKSSAPSRPPAGAEQSPQVEALMSEVGELRAMLHSVTSRIGQIQSEYTLKEFADLPAPYADQVMALMQSGVDTRIARSLVERAAATVPVDRIHEKGRLHAALLEQIEKKIQVAGPIRCQRGEARIIVLVGPTGSGKTTTLAKLAANSKFVFDKKVALITADTHRVSAIEHLNTFAGISQLPISAVYSPEELRAALMAQRDKDLIFIDTAGRSPRDEKHLQELQRFLDMAEPTEIHLVLPGSIHHLDLLETLRRFSVLRFNRVVISKTDETSAMGNLLNIAVESAHPVSYITTGQTIPDDIELANAQRLAQMIMRSV